MQVVKRAGVKGSCELMTLDLYADHSFTVDKLEQMLGSYGPAKAPYTKNFEPETSPSGMVVRTGSYHVRSRVVDDDGEVYAG